MKRFIATICLAACFLQGLQAQSYNLTINGKIDGLQSGRLFMLVPTGENKTDTVGTALFNGPDFILKGKVTEPVVARIVVEKYEGGFTFLAEPGTNYTAFLKNGSGSYIRGGKMQDEWQNFMTAINLKKQYTVTLKTRYDSLMQAGKFRSASIANDSLTAFRNKINNETAAFLQKHDDLITAFTYQDMAFRTNASLEESRKMYNALGPGAKKTLSAQIMKERIDRLAQTSTGHAAPDFTLPDVKGHPIALSSVKGKIKILDFWASWCGPCRMNNPALRSIYADFHPKGLEIISVSLDTSKKNWEDAIAKDQLPWIHLSSLKGWKCPAVQLYNVTAVPAIFILDENNHIIARDLRGAKLRNYLSEKLK